MSNVTVHLISMPWAYPTRTPIQLGCLKAYVDKAFKNNKRVSTYTYSAFLTILLNVFGENFMTAYNEINSLDSAVEIFYQQIFFKNYTSSKNKIIISKILKNIKLDNDILHLLYKSTIEFIEKELVPKFKREGINIIGFTMDFNQVYSSLVCAKHLAKYYNDRNLLFVYGGTSANLRATLQVFKKFKVRHLVVKGEGEVKLKKIIDNCLMNGPDNLPDLSPAGIYNIKGIDSESYFRHKVGREMQISSINTLPPPAYDEYFKSFDKYNIKGKACNKSDLALHIEGSRGCTGRCDFCSDPSVWGGYRVKDHKKIIDQTRYLMKKHRVNNVFFTSVCDIWASLFADNVIKNNICINFDMELRSKHPESFFTKLALAGCKSVMLGIDSLSSTLLKKMNKGVSLMDNLQALKYLNELQIYNCSPNIMINHPKSTLSDVEETKSVFKHIPHFNALCFTYFHWSENSLLYNQLDVSHKKDLVLANPENLPEDVLKYSVGNMYRLRCNLNSKVASAWDKLVDWYKKQQKTEHYMNVIRISESTLLIKDGRYGNYKEIILNGDKAIIYNKCHKSQTIDNLVGETGLNIKNISKIIDELKKKFILIEVDDRFLSLALRPRDELLRGHIALHFQKIS